MTRGKPKEAPSEQDSPWKEILEQFFPEFLAFFFPLVHTRLDWSKGYSFKDKELQRVVREAQTKSRRVDKLAAVYLQGGVEVWVLIHIEIQGQAEAEFPERMFIYHYRIYDRYRVPVASLALLTDDQASWRPQQYQHELFGCRATLDFPSVKLLDYREHWDALTSHASPFALVVMAHLQMQATRRNDMDRYGAKLRLIRLAYQKGYERKAILELLRFIDWVLALPEDLEQQLQVEVSQLEEETMSYVTSWERMGEKKGIRLTARDFIIKALQTRFAEVPQDISEAIERIDDPDELDRLHTLAIVVKSLPAFAEALPENE
ncbi:MAG: cytosolic protein [Chloroflexi bacterium]|nr:cytosolic protein [Chloroflexota bacterium]